MNLLQQELVYSSCHPREREKKSIGIFWPSLIRFVHQPEIQNWSHTGSQTLRLVFLVSYFLNPNHFLRTKINRGKACHQGKASKFYFLIKWRRRRPRAFDEHRNYDQSCNRSSRSWNHKIMLLPTSGASPWKSCSMRLQTHIYFSIHPVTEKQKPPKKHILLTKLNLHIF